MTLDIDLWLWSLDQPDHAPAFSNRLSADEHARAARFVRDRDRFRFITGRARLREVLAPYAGRAPEKLSFSYGPQGKPSLPGGPVFNLSHSDGWAALVVAPQSTDGALQLGVDIEAERPVEDGVAARFFSVAEYATLHTLPAKDQRAAFFRCWTRKEAVIKAAGTGLSTPLDSFDVTLAPGAPANVARTSGDLAPVDAWSLTHLDLGPQFVGAVAVVSQGQSIRLSLKQGSLPVR